MVAAAVTATAMHVVSIIDCRVGSNEHKPPRSGVGEKTLPSIVVSGWQSAGVDGE